MAFVRTETVTVPESTHERRITTCDICGDDATGLVGCTECKRDLCRKHQITVDEIGSYKKWEKINLITGVHCKACLIEKIKANYPG